MNEDLIIEELYKDYYTDIVDYSHKPLIEEEILIHESTNS